MTATIAAVRALRVEIATAAVRVRVHHLHVEIATAAVLAHVHDRHAATAAVLRAVTAAVLLAVTAVAHRPPLQLHRHPGPSLVLRLAPVAAIAVAPAPHHLPKEVAMTRVARAVAGIKPDIPNNLIHQARCMLSR